MSNIIAIKFDFIQANRWTAVDNIFDIYAANKNSSTLKIRLCDSINKWLQTQNCPYDKNHGFSFDASSLTKQAEYLICDVSANILEWVWSNDGEAPIEISCAQHHKCHCDRWLVFNQGCKCGGI